MANRNDQNDWAKQVPWTRFRGPYRDYGWERGQSALPEFRDPDVHFMPYERENLEPWQQGYPRSIIYPKDLPGGNWNQAGPHTGKGPRGYTRSDERIYEEVCERMMQHGQLDASDINVEVENGEVTLTGNVSDRQTKRLAGYIADTVSGVRDVHNRLQLHEKRSRSTPARWRDEVGRSGVYPASAGNAPEDSQEQGMASWGQGERGAQGYKDHGDSEIHPERGNGGK